MSPDISLLKSKASLYPAAPRGLVSSSVYVILWGICIPNQAIAMSVFILVAVVLSLPTAAFPCGNILFPFVLSIVAPGTVIFCIPCNIPSLHPPGVLFPTLLPHLFLPSILGRPFPSCHVCASRIPTSVPTARFVSGRSPVHLVAWPLCPPRERVVVVYLTVDLETFRNPL